LSRSEQPRNLCLKLHEEFSIDDHPITAESIPLSAMAGCFLLLPLYYFHLVQM